MLTRPVPKSARIGVLGTAAIVITAALLLPMAKAERSNKDAPVTPQTAAVDAPAKAPVAAESDVFVDPQTGIRFTKFKTISGPSDVIEYSGSLNLSPNGKFLLWGVRVVPLDGSSPFDLVNMPDAGRGSWSPDGKKVVFYCGAIWLIEVDPETGRPAGSAKRLLEGDYDSFQAPVRWSSDSRRIIFPRRDSQIQDQVWSLSIENGELSQVVDPFTYGIVSPDGKMVACSAGQGLIYQQNCLLVKPAAGGEARKVIDRFYPVVWSADSEWLVCKLYINAGWQDEIRFVRVADGREVKITSPGFMIRQSPQGKKLLFYHGSYDRRGRLKVVSATGGRPAEFEWPSMSSHYRGPYQLWTLDSRSILLEGQPKGGNWGLWALPLDGKDPQPLTIDHPVRWKTDLDFRMFSPDGSKLLLSVGGQDRTFDLWVMRISLARMESTGSAVKVFEAMVPSDPHWWIYLNAWSPDSSKIAFIHKGDVWVVSANSKDSIQITKTSEQAVRKEFGVWSPDGTMIAFLSYPSWETAVFHVVPASGGEPRVIADVTLGSDAWLPFYAWSPDGKELTVVSEGGGVISSFPISGGNGRTLVRPKDMGIHDVGGLRWSPDGRFLAFHGVEGGNQNLYVYRADSTKLERLDDWCYAPRSWSPDSKWISYLSGRDVKVRPEGILWEMDVEEALAKLAK